ncbi:MAG: IS66-like element accessory protein TnpA [Panacagrimonas sp.]
MSQRLAEVVPGFVVGRKKNGRCIYSREGKRALIEQCLEPGVSVARLALIHEVNANLLRKWIRAYQDGGSAARLRQLPKETALLPVLAVESSAPTPKMRSVPAESLIEILIGAATIRLRGAVDAQQLRTVMDCLAART